MKRKALLIGNTHNLTGVQLDIERMKSFLKSPVGGAWYTSEIEEFQNPAKNTFINRINALKLEGFDYVIVLFSGHGGYKRETVLELNGNGETIQESQLFHIAPRQLSIFDCCRCVSPEIKKSMAFESLTARLSESLDDTRQKYDTRIMEAIPQQVQLYACAIGQYSYDTSNGAIYLQNLLSSAKSINQWSEFKTIESAHSEAREKTISDKKEQTPEATLPKCLTSQQLIISLKA